jgi:hypothetical protein
MCHDLYTPNLAKYSDDLHYNIKLEDFELEAAWQRELKLLSGNILLIKGKGLPSLAHRLLLLGNGLPQMNCHKNGVPVSSNTKL